MVNFEKFYITWYSRVKNFARSYVISESEAENIAQDVFLHIYEKEIIFDTNINLVGYLFTSVKNRCLDYLRKETTKQKSMAFIEEEMKLTLRFNREALEEFDSTLIQSEESIQDLLNRALDKLPDKCRKIFVMNKFEGKKQKEIAEELKISKNTVETQMGIAYKKLRVELKDFIPLLIFIFLEN